MTHPEDAKLEGFNAVFGAGWSVMQVSFWFSAYIVYTVAMRWKREGGIGISLRFPMYIGIIDMGLSLSLLTNQMHTVLHRRTWVGWECKAVAAHVAFWVVASMTLTTTIAAITYLRVVREMVIDTGRFDWKILAVVFGHAMFWALVGLPSYGPSRYWCYQENYGSNKAAGLIITGVEFILFGITAVLFLMVVQALRKHRKSSDIKTTMTMNPSQMNSMARVVNSAQKQLKQSYISMETKATRKMLLYIFNFFIQWTSVVPYCFGSAFDFYADWIYIICTIGMNSGGILNIISFTYNESGKNREPVVMGSSATATDIKSASQ